MEHLKNSSRSLENGAQFRGLSNTAPKIIYQYDCYLQTLPYSQEDKKVISNPKIEFGTWREYCYINDYNGNGLDEILIFEKTGMSFEPVICEFRNDKMEKVLVSPSSYWNSVRKFETGIDIEGKYIKIWTSRETIKSKIPWYTYRWDNEKLLYLIKEKGFDEQI